MPPMMTDTEKLLEKAIHSLDREIEAVLERPSRDVLHNGKRVDSGEAQHVHYRFETQNPALQYAETFKAEIGNQSFETGLVEIKEQEIVLDFPEDQGKTIPEVSLEWENDFILQKIRDELLRLSSDLDSSDQNAIECLFKPESDPGEEATALEAYDNGKLNTAQLDGLTKAINNRVTFIWGPPGTGKTSTLGYIAANFLLYDKSVLFVSNTNRAVDVGMLNLLKALEELQETKRTKWCTRFGEMALDDKVLHSLSFDHQMEIKLQDRRAKAAKLRQILDSMKQGEEERERCLAEGEVIPESLDMRMGLLTEKIDNEGGLEAIQARFERLMHVNEHNELRKNKLIATTLARVCTSDLFNNLNFDAVIVDEASMANLPYLLIMATRTDSHIVVVGDPMQLPPISLTTDAEASQFLQQDIFGYVSEADSPGALFEWHDHHPEFTCFFDTQYRLKQDLAGLISKAFYEGRLKSAGESQPGKPDRSLALIDSSRYGPVLETGPRGKGFHPGNEIHRELVGKIIHWLVFKNHTPMNEIGVMVPFRNTVYDLRKQLYKSGFRDVEVGTIHTFQGREKEAIIFDTVMTAEKHNGYERHFSVRPFDEAKNGLSVPRLLNVAFSRSKRLLLVIADMHHIQKVYHHKFLGKLLEQIPEVKEGLLE